SAQIREILINESAWEEMTCLFALSLGDVPRIELFARQSSHGFDVWGNQCESPAVALLPGIAEYIGEVA
ncbi:hypothetical protein NXF52_28720, partial [Klebsiella pneumoniae]|nr:hypothetical protein [Klebsiella pneumoniae]MDS6815586.1 hypothetical protein [Klebsiella pneumoniae]MDS6876018.1 hypothetical protein [Klebsiella pneumoniae]MDS6886944.1 hypothetical protein [Klebsiella pneumoniae]MDS6936995.1 hypothetical protein [Klebsiella pneumoniae]